MTMCTLSRRGFIASAVALLAGIVTFSGHAMCALSSHRRGNRLLAIYSHDFRAALAIGCAYLRATPDEKDADLLTGIILRRDPTLATRLDTLEEQQLAGILKNLIAEDFASGHTVQIDGWVLSKTEARLCALCSLR